MGLPRRMMACGLAQQIGKLFLRGRDPNVIGRDRHDIVRIIGWFRIQRGMHGSSVLSPMSPHHGGRRIDAYVDDVPRHTPARFDQSKAIQWRVWGSLASPFREPPLE